MSYLRYIYHQIGYYSNKVLVSGSSHQVLISDMP